MFSFINMSIGMYFTAVTGLLNTTWLHKVFSHNSLAGLDVDR